MAACDANRLRRHDVVPGPQDRVRDDDAHRDVHLVARRGVGIPGLVDEEPVEVGDPLDSRIVLGEQVEDGLPEGLGDTGLDGHAATAPLEGPA